MARIGEKSGGEGENMIGVNIIHKESSTSANRVLFERGYTIREANHNHPSVSPSSSRGDVTVAGLIQDKFPKAKFNNYTQQHGYTPYNRNTPAKNLYNGGVLPTINVVFRRDSTKR